LRKKRKLILDTGLALPE